jgi:glutamate dehydrogenase (NAD(P)+)
MRFGRMERRMVETRSEAMINIFDQMLGKAVPPELALGLRREVDELNLVRSGLDDTMRNSYEQIRELWRAHEGVPDLRTAAYMLAIEKIAHYYTNFAL